MPPSEDVFFIQNPCQDLIDLEHVGYSAATYGIDTALSEMFNQLLGALAIWLHCLSCVKRKSLGHDNRLAVFLSVPPILMSHPEDLRISKGYILRREFSSYVMIETVKTSNSAVAGTNV